MTEETASSAAAANIDSIGKKAGRGLRWSLLGNLVTKAGSFVMGLVLARLLTSTDFGIYAIALAATQFVMVMKDLGVMAATVQWRGKLEEMSPTASLLALSSAVGLYAVFWFGAPWFSELAGSTTATPVVRLLTAVILVEALTAVRAAALLRRFEHDKLTKALLAGFAVNALVAITLAMNGAGPYSFAWGQVSAAVVTGVIVFFSAKVPVRLGLNREIAGKLLRFGLPSAVGIGLETVLLNAGYIIVGNIMGTVALGFYLLAFNVSSWVPGLIGTAVRYVSLPSFSRLAEEKGEALSLGVQRSVPLLYAFVLPIAILIGTLAHPLVAVLYGERWDQAAGVLRLLMPLMVVRMLTSIALDILTSQGATKATMWMNVGYGVALFPMVIIGTHLGGIRGAATGHALAALLVALPLAVLALRHSGVRLAPLLPALVRPSVGGVLACGVTWGVSTLFAGTPFLQLLFGGTAGLVTFVSVVVPAAQLKMLSARAGALLPIRSR
ncbi:oligosaccharide flippase family protein [Streptosporangium soli]|nr:oligosaccharide flippase family protein [Streptosporangium sp. KLBMP 9127]